MQTLAWSTIVVLVLLLPGFCFFPGLYAPEQFSRDLTPRNPLGSLAAIVLVALGTHAVLSLIFGLLNLHVRWDRIIEAMLLSPTPPRTAAGSPPVTTPQLLADYYWEDAIRIPLYIILSCVWAWVLGIAVGNAAVRGYFPILSPHPWASAISRDQATFAFILSDVEHNGNVLLYKGRLLHFGLNAEGGYSYVMLTGTEQGYLSLGRAPKASDFAVIGRRAQPEPTPPPERPGKIRRLIHAAGLARLRVGVESGAVLSIAASNMRDIIIQTFPTPVGTTEVRGDIFRYQETLQVLGCYHGAIDGRPGPQFDAALAQFQEMAKIDGETGLGEKTRQMLDTLGDVPDDPPSDSHA